MEKSSVNISDVQKAEDWFLFCATKEHWNTLASDSRAT